MVTLATMCGTGGKESSGFKNFRESNRRRKTSTPLEKLGEGELGWFSQQRLTVKASNEWLAIFNSAKIP